MLLYNQVKGNKIIQETNIGRNKEMTRTEFANTVKAIMERTNELLKEAKTEEEKFSILEAQNMNIAAVVKGMEQ